MTRSIADFVVVGTPVPQGSMKSQRGKVRHSDGERLHNWREAIRGACLEEMRRETAPIWTPWEGPVELNIYFVYKPPTKADSEQRKLTSPDLDKLTRAVLDALTGTLYVDDRQVVALEARKDYGQWAPASDGGCEPTCLVVNAMRVES